MEKIKPGDHFVPKILPPDLDEDDVLLAMEVTKTCVLNAGWPPHYWPIDDVIVKYHCNPEEESAMRRDAKS